MSQINLHSENFDLCRICLLKPEVDRNVKFSMIFPDDDGNDFNLHRKIEEMFGEKIEKEDIKPKIICENCLNDISKWAAMKKTYSESSIILNYLAKSKLTPPTTSNAPPNSSLNSNNKEKPTRVQPESKETELLPFEKRNRRNLQNIRLPSSYKLFTCLKPSCDLIFESIYAFKCHFRKHFECEDNLMCWACCIPFSNISQLRKHQQRSCRTPNKFDCYKCSEKFDDLEGLSIHKLTFHKSQLVSYSFKNSENTIECAFCQKDIVIQAFKKHLHKYH
ncbi:uncharacterized protein LOC132935353 [Metopolophium dirhodum]|uniref:uncharacterized protein LOC132935353 n=1 Tax=Metopolophium dirhodum TaxID=44670 RepID=UPI00298FB4B5|nr:uncharacterized protein LOC132935353 [Metopolophium dirhodum]